MDAATWWGLAFLIYIGGGGLALLAFMHGRQARRDAREAFYPGRAPESGWSTWAPQGVWIAGLVVLLCARYA